MIFIMLLIILQDYIMMTFLYLLQGKTEELQSILNANFY